MANSWPCLLWRGCSVLVLVVTLCPGSAQGETTFEPSSNAQVTVEQGSLEGAEPAPGIYAYLGIPYAKAPAGELRWRPPQAAEHWTGTRAANEHGHPCPQQDSGWKKSAAEHGSEDCLYLNVWTRAQAHGLPVMIYIHGGSNVAGSAAEDLSNGLHLVPRSVVLVTFDYRLGIFGFFRTAELDGESSHHASGNYGLLDQMAALQWVQHNIARFGGDPGKVTVFGQSAGAVDTGLLMTSPLARGLFRAAIEESGQVLGLMPTATREESENAWDPVAKQIGTDLAAQRRATTADVLRADRNAPKPPPVTWWGWRGASVDGWVLPEEPWRVFAKGEEAPVGLMLGSNVQEIVPRNQAPDQLRHSLDNTLGAEDASRLLAIYGNAEGDRLLGDASARWPTDHFFRCAVRQIAVWHAVHGYPTFVYQFDRPTPGEPAAFHSSELFYVFDYFRGTPSAEDEQVADAIERYWTSFAQNGEPQGPATWPSFAPTRLGPYLHIPQRGTNLNLAEDLGGRACVVIEHSYPK